MGANDQKTKGVVDMVFLIDATGSMQHCINALKNNINTFVKSLGESRGNEPIVKDWRAMVFGFRDVEDDPQSAFVENDFITDITEFERQLSRLKASGGGDEPESLLDALYKVATMGETRKDEEPQPRKWRYRSAAARVVIIFTDAPYKTNLQYPTGGNLDDVLNAVESNRIIMSIFAPDIECYELLSEADKAEWMPIEGENPQEALQQFTKDQANFEKTLQQLAKSVSKSAGTTVVL